MAERRMFAKTIIDSDAFLDMPLTTQALYFHLSMRADDEGFINNPKKIVRMIGAGEDELKLLFAKGYVIPFDSGVVVIKHWRIHNYLRSDRFKPTIYMDERAMVALKENNEYTLVHGDSENGIPTVYQTDTNGIPTVNRAVYQMDTQYSIGKDSIDKDSIGEDRREDAPPAHAHVPYQEIMDLYNATCVSYPRCKSMSEARKKAIRARFNAGYTLDDFRVLFTKAEASSFLKGKNNRNWSATFDWMLKDANMSKVLDGNYDDRDVYYEPSELDALF